MTDPMILLPLDEMFGATLRDESGGRRNATAEGTVRVVDDVVFGGCVELSGGRLVLPPIPRGDLLGPLLLTLWFDGGPPGTLVSLGPTGGVSSDGTAVVFGSARGESARGQVLGSGWQFLAVQITAMGAVLGSDGVPNGVGWMFDDPVVISLGGGASAGRPQRLARFRLFRGFPSPAEIERVRQLDLGQPARDPALLPIALSFEDDDAVRAFPSGRLEGATMHLRVDTSRPTSLRLENRTGVPVSPQEHDLRVTFRPGVLRDLTRVQVVDPGWQLALQHDDDGDTLFLLSTDPRQAPFSVAISGLLPQSQPGTRSTRVQLGYRNLVQDETGRRGLSGTCGQQLGLPDGSVAWEQLPLQGGWDTPVDMRRPEGRRDGSGAIHLRGGCTAHIDDTIAARGPVTPFVPPSTLLADGPVWIAGSAEVRRLVSGMAPVRPPELVPIYFDVAGVTVDLRPIVAREAPSAGGGAGYAVRLLLDGVTFWSKT